MKDQVLSHKFISRSICVQQQVSHMLPQLVQLKEGLSSWRLLYSVQKYPKIWEPVFVSSNRTEVTGSTVLGEIEPIYNESQVKRQKETDVYYQFSEFVHTLARNAHEGLTAASLLQWITGATDIPPLGFSRKIKCYFLHNCKQDCQCRPTVSTCDLSLTLPIHSDDEEQMQHLMVSALKGSIGFTRL
eukprot:Seg5121.1 transcript_id=Seg5121.1/GoldUCD/mRNA.D3Y31 product="hypothetical protein" protein_id=Seg5121.1/GoldUCD/D3Y31